MAHIRAQSYLVKWIKVVQRKDSKLSKLMEGVKSDKNLDFALDSEGVLHCGNHLCVPDYEGLREVILEEAHNSKHLVHLGSVKMYQDLK